MAAFYSLLCKAIKKQPAGRSGRLFWRSGRDSNPRAIARKLISSAAPSTTRTTLRVYFRPVFFPEICSKIRWRENRRDGKKYSILRFSVLRNIKENQGDEIPSFCRNFECSSLQPLRYASMYKYSLLGTNHMISRVVKQPKPPCISAYLLIGYLRKAL